MSNAVFPKLVYHRPTGKIVTCTDWDRDTNLYALYIGDGSTIKSSGDDFELLHENSDDTEFTPLVQPASPVIEGTALAESILASSHSKEELAERAHVFLGLEIDELLKKFAGRPLDGCRAGIRHSLIEAVIEVYEYPITDELGLGDDSDSLYE